MNNLLNLAHRGASGHAPENTLAAIRLARALGADGIEIDVHLSSDGQAILLHDDTLERTSNGFGLAAEWTLPALKKLDAGTWFSAAYAGEPIPTLQEVVEALADSFFVNVEMKAGPAIATLVAQVAAQLRPSRLDYILTSFDRSALRQAASLDASIPLGLIFEADREQALAEEWPILSVWHELVDEDYIARCHQAGKKVFVWTVDETALLHKMIALRVDGIMTNYPDRLAELRKD